MSDAIIEVSPGSHHCRPDGLSMYMAEAKSLARGGADRVSFHVLSVISS